MGFPWGAIADFAGAGLSFLGGQLGQSQQSGQFGQSMQLAQQQLQFQREAAQNGVTWRVEDAKRAGISPLVALGAPTFNPGAIGVNVPDATNPMQGAGDLLGRAGQDISDSVRRTMTDEQKQQQAAQLLLTKAQLDKAGAETDYTRALTASVVARMSQQPSMPSAVDRNGFIAGQGNAPQGHSPGGISADASGGFVNEPPKLTTENPGMTGAVSGPASPMGIFRRNAQGALVYEDAPGTQAATIGGWTTTENWIRNRLLPYVSPSSSYDRRPPDSMLPSDASHWEWSSRAGGWIPARGLDPDARRAMYQERYGRIWPNR